jgi:exoribonuclease R
LLTAQFEPPNASHSPAHFPPFLSFKPLSPSLPDFQVPCKWGFTERNRLLVIEFIDWKASSKRPQGAVKMDLGSVGDILAEAHALQLHYRPPFAPKRAIDEATKALAEMVNWGGGGD